MTLLCRGAPKGEPAWQMGRIRLPETWGSRQTRGTFRTWTPAMPQAHLLLPVPGSGAYRQRLLRPCYLPSMLSIRPLPSRMHIQCRFSPTPTKGARPCPAVHGHSLGWGSAGRCPVYCLCHLGIDEGPSPQTNIHPG